MCVNDDIQGTGAVTLAGIMSALHVSKVAFSDVRIVMFGAGTAGTGIADQIQDAIAVESKSSKEEAGKQIWCVDKPGLLTKSMDSLTIAQKPFARDDSEKVGDGSLLSVIKSVKPHVLIGCSTVPGAFTQQIVQEMAAHVERPIIFPLSNRTRLHEAKPADLFAWTDGKVLCATGSPFAPVQHAGKSYEVAECNNSTCFPGIGLGVVLCRPRLLPPSLIVAAVKALAREAPALRDPTAALLPDVTDVRPISVQIAKAVIRAAEKEGLAQVKDIPADDADLEEWIRDQMWDPSYRPLKRVDPANASTAARGEVGAASIHRVAA